LKPGAWIYRRKENIGRLARDASDSLKEISWVVFMLCNVLIALILIFGRYVGYGAMARVCVGFGLLLIVIFGILFGINLIGAVLTRALKQSGRRKERV
jgi:hypothetical protein